MDHPIDLDQLEHEISAASPSLLPQGPDSYAPPPRLRDLPIPPYVEHSKDINDFGKLTSAAVIAPWEAAAKDIEAMGNQLIEEAGRCDQVLKEIKDSFKQLSETAQMYRNLGKEHFARIENASRIAQKVKAICDELRMTEVTADGQ